jgi:hypothetical protein
MHLRHQAVRRERPHRPLARACARSAAPPGRGRRAASRSSTLCICWMVLMRGVRIGHAHVIPSRRELTIPPRRKRKCGAWRVRCGDSARIGPMLWRTRGAAELLTSAHLRPPRPAPLVRPPTLPEKGTAPAVALQRAFLAGRSSNPEGACLLSTAPCRPACLPLPRVPLSPPPTPSQCCDALAARPGLGSPRASHTARLLGRTTQEPPTFEVDRRLRAAIHAASECCCLPPEPQTRAGEPRKRSHAGVSPERSSPEPPDPLITVHTSQQIICRHVMLLCARRTGTSNMLTTHRLEM